MFNEWGNRGISEIDKPMKKKKDFITKKIKIPKGYKASELVSNDSSGVIVFDKKKVKK